MEDLNGEDYKKYKLIVKSWEKTFKEKFGRVPSKHDIKEANPKVRIAYRNYFRMKTNALEESLIDIDFGIDSYTNSIVEQDVTSVDNIDEVNKSIEIEVDENNKECIDNNSEMIQNKKVWGEHLNKKKSCEIKTKLQTKNTISLSQKLFAGSKFTKSKSFKSISFTSDSKTKSCSDISLSQDNLSNINDEINTELMSIFGDKFKVIENTKQCSTQALNCIQKVLNDDALIIKRNINIGWIERSHEPDFSGDKTDNLLENHTGFEPTKNVVYGLSNIPVDISKINSIIENKCNNGSDIDSDEIICNSESEDEVGRLRKRRKIMVSKSKCDNLDVKNNKLESLKKDESVKRINYITNEENLNTSHENHKSTEISENIGKSSPKNTDENKSQTRRTKKKSKNVNAENTEEKPLPSRKNYKRSVKNKNIVQDECSTDDDPFHSDNDYDKDPDFELEVKSSEEKQKELNLNIKTKPKVKAKKNILKTKNPNEIVVQKKIKRTSPKNKEDVDINEEPNTEIEISRMPLPTTVPRFETIKNLKKKTLKTKIMNASVKASSKNEKNKEKLEQKIKSGSVNDNFVRINLKKKVFVRGKKTMNFSKYKKKQWLDRKKVSALCGEGMDMGGCDGGMLTCFKCGETGHFARQCKIDKGDDLLPLDADSDVSAYPTLEEAAAMAKNSALSRHIPTLISNKEKAAKETEEVNDDDNKDNTETFDFSSDECNDEELLNLVNVLENAHENIPSIKFTSNDVQPVYALKEDGSVIDTPQEVYDALKIFGYSSFRFGQERTIMRILSGLSTLVTLSTGSGKSLCYQLPAYMYSRKQHSIALVVSPLVSLMEDQATRSERIACLHTSMTETARKKVLVNLQSGSLDALLVSPEAVVNIDSLLRYLPPVSFACIDEVHCVSQWSHNFRPSYLTVCRVLRERVGVKILLGLTATAPYETVQNIFEHLDIKDGENGLISSAPLPSNLLLTVSKDSNRDAALIALLSSEQLKCCRSIVVYCTRREECQRVAGILRTYFREENANSQKRKRYSWVAEPYHAGLSASRRRIIQSNFMSGELRIVVATVAFGMGIDKPDIRVVIHYNMPSSFESYVQEVGRAGRDGLPAYCHMFLDTKSGDKNELRRHIYADSIDRYVIRKLLQKVFVPCDCPSRNIKCPKHEVAFSIEETVKDLDIPEQNISTLLCYLELHENRYIQVLSPAYTRCKITSYGGQNALQKAAMSCAPLAMAFALRKQHGSDNSEKVSNVIEFAVVDVAAAIGWDSGIVKHQLKNLEWISENGVSKRSTLSVTFSSLGFHIRAPGDMSSEDLDSALDSLYSRVVQQEKTSVIQLHLIHMALNQVVSKTFMIDDKDAKDKSDNLKQIIFEYFESKEKLEIEPDMKSPTPVNEDLIRKDVRSIVCLYRDNTFTGRAVARIFHGIASPNYPAFIWGRCKFWRKYLNVDFNIVYKIATEELLRMR